jgi:hypothetical protein
MPQPKLLNCESCTNSSADRLEDAAVERALRDGWSWGLVAEALGVTRQAVHKKHVKRLADADIDLRRRRG